ncbi:MAG: hypothetical protein WAK89_19100 [Candidatus Sulfotelmatobacter sp.]
MKIHPVVRFVAFSLLLLAIPAVLSSTSSAQIGIGISVRIGPPALPVYEQPICPGPGYLWTPGYWAWSDDAGYYWVPGTWVVAPVGLLWTPGYWGWNDGVYVWNAGYWGPHIGFYGGINYGFGYGGVGFVGGEWRGGRFFYNTAVMHVNTTQITNVYVNRTVIVNNESHVAFNGGEGGVAARPTAQEEAYSREKHTPRVAAQVRQQHAASQDKALFASNNHGAPAVAATAKPGVFSGAGVVRAKSAGAPYHAPTMSPKEARASAPAGGHPATPKGEKAASHSGAPAKGTVSSRARSENANKEKAAHASESHPAKTSAPSSHASTPRREPKTAATGESHAASKPRPTVKESAPKESASKPSHSVEPKPESKPAAPRESAPKESAPKPSHSARAPKPQKASPQPRPESKPESKPKGR